MKRIYALTALAAAFNLHAANYVQPLQCQATGIMLNSPSTSATVQCPNTPPPTGCTKPPVITSSTPGIANFQRWTGSQTVFFCSTGCGKSVDVTSFNAVYGTWPGKYGLIATYQLPVKNYLAEAFTIPPNYMTAPNAPVPLYGAYKVGETGADTTQALTISTSCGDFSNPAVYPTSTVVAGCWKNKASSSANLLQWKNQTNCILKDSTTYYLNIINADVSQVQPNGGIAASTKNVNCSPYVCSTPIMDGPGNWNGYVPITRNVSALAMQLRKNLAD